MGRTQKPLKIVVFPPLEEWDEIKALAEQGHEIIDLRENREDIVMGPHCWRMDEEHRQYLDLAIKEARKVRYPKGVKDDPAD